ncbi:response regulator, partial [Klebsiella pneumoniae]|uniref:response regulator n=2 Tax=Pseudomonadota TaxID=1224 RepID=UPI0013D51B2B
FDAIVLDRMLPGIDGLAVLKMLRAGGVATPILLLTAMARIADRVEGLESGADDYLVKPFAFSELRARLNVLIRRPSAASAPAETV